MSDVHSLSVSIRLAPWVRPALDRIVAVCEWLAHVTPVWARPVLSPPLSLAINLATQVIVWAIVRFGVEFSVRS